MSYCTNEDVESLFGDVSDTPTHEMVETARDNATAWIDINLKKHYIPIPQEEVPSALKTAAIYYAASDVLIPLYHGDDDMPIQYDVWFNKAQLFLDTYIESYNNSEAEESDLIAHQPVKHSKALTYNQKRRRRRWVR